MSAGDGYRYLLKSVVASGAVTRVHHKRFTGMSLSRRNDAESNASALGRARWSERLEHRPTEGLPVDVSGITCVGSHPSSGFGNRIVVFWRMYERDWSARAGPRLCRTRLLH